MIPKPLRERFGLNPYVEVDFVPTERGLLLQKRSEGMHLVDRLTGILTDFEYENTDEFIEEIRRR